MATVQQLMNMEGRVSVVTGGASGIGLRMALGLAWRPDEIYTVTFL